MESNIEKKQLSYLQNKYKKLSKKVKSDNFAIAKLEEQ